MRIRHLLIFEPEWGGHQEEYIRLLASPKNIISLRVEVSFLVQPLLFNQLFRSEEFIGKSDEIKKRFILLNEREISMCMCPILWLRSLYRWRIAKNYLFKTGADHVHFSYFDHIQLPMAFGLSMDQKKTISGLLFRPTIHYSKIGVKGISMTEKLRDHRKYFLYKMMLKNPSMVRLFCLDPYFVKYAKQDWLGGHKLRYLADPLLVEDDNEYGDEFGERLDWLNVPKGRKIFLLFGALHKRKGIIQLLSSLNYLTPYISKQIAILLIGRLEKSCKREVNIMLKNYLFSSNDKVFIHIEDRFVSKREIIALLKIANCILAPYQRFVGSSGVIVWAAFARKPVITQDYGLIGKIVKDYKLGKIIDTTNPKKIAESIELMVTHGYNAMKLKKGCEEFLFGRQPEEYRKSFYRELCNI